jgi:cathepsin D
MSVHTSTHSAQQFNVILDSGSSDLWLAGTHCTTCPSGTHQYDSTKSSTFANSTGIVTVRYAGGAIEGTLVKDTVSMSGFIVSQQTFRK